MNKNLKYFMLPKEPEIVTVPGPASFKDEEGNIIQFEIKVLPQEKIQEINDAYRTRRVATDRRGKPIVENGEVVFQTERDTNRAARHIIVEALQYPDLKNKELMDYYGCVDVTDMPLKVFPRTDDYIQVMETVMKVLGVTPPDEDEDLQTAKN